MDCNTFKDVDVSIGFTLFFISDGSEMEKKTLKTKIVKLHVADVFYLEVFGFQMTKSASLSSAMQPF